MRQHDFATTDFKRANTLDPKRLPWKEAVRAYSQLIARNSQDVDAYHLRAQALDRLGRHTEALKDRDQALARNTSPVSVRFYRSYRALTLVRAGEHAKAIAELNALAEAKDTTGNNLYALASFIALATVAAEDEVKLQDQYANRAVAMLRRAVAMGYKNVARMKIDPNLDSLRKREDF